MHIPDGYISPAVSVPALAAMVPVWGAALNKQKNWLEGGRYRCWLYTLLSLL
jgi:hypothetical protein